MEASFQRFRNLRKDELSAHLGSGLKPVLRLGCMLEIGFNF